MPIRRVPMLHTPQIGGAGDIWRSVKQADGTYNLFKASYTDQDQERLNGNPDAPYDSAWDSLQWQPMGKTTNEHTQLASDHQTTTDLYWNGQPNQPDTGLGFYLKSISPAAQAQFKSWFYAGSHMPREWLTHYQGE